MAHNKRVIRTGKACFTTHVVRNHAPLFTRPDRMQFICKALQHARESRGLKIYGYVIMPDHLHLLSDVTSPMELRKTLISFRRFTAKNLLQQLKADAVAWAIAQLECGEQDLDLWKPAYTPKDASREDIFQQKLAYIHDNPVRTGFVRRASDWQFSSAAAYEGNEDLTGPPPLRIDFPWEEDTCLNGTTLPPK